MILSSLKKICQKSKKRPGRGYGSGKGGHTTGRGSKGDKVRGTTPLTFDGTKIKKSWLKRLPLSRGKNLLKSFSSTIAVSIDRVVNWYPKSKYITKRNILEKVTVRKNIRKGILIKITDKKDFVLKQKITFADPVKVTKTVQQKIDKINEAK